MQGQGPHCSNCSFGLLSCQVTSQDKAPSVISRVLKKNNRDSAVASEYELVQLLPGERGQGLGGKTDSGGEGRPPVAVLPHPGGRAGMTALDTSLSTFRADHPRLGQRLLRHGRSLT